MSTWSEFPLKARWIASTILQTLSMLLTASLVNRPCSSTLCYVLKPPIWSHCVPIAANLALENVAQKTINSLPNLVIKCAPHHTETVRRITPKCRLSSRHSAQLLTVTPSDNVIECMRIMTEKRVRHLPVLEGTNLVGILSIGDAVKWFISTQTATIDDLERYIGLR